jgi:hypothetical protein
LSSRSGPGDLKSLRLIRRDLDTGDDTELHRTQSTGIGFFGLTVSSDGSKLAFSVNVADRRRALMVMRTDGGSPREIYRTTVDDLSHHGAMIWTKDGKHLIVTARCGPGGQQLCAIPAEGGDLRPLGLGMSDITTRMIASDGRRLAITHETRSPELWAIRNLLTQTATSR